MKTSRASAHAVCKSSARQDVTLVPPMSERMKGSLLRVDAEWNAHASAPMDSHLILMDWLHFKVCSFDRLAAGRVRPSCMRMGPGDVIAVGPVERGHAPGLCDRSSV